MIIETVLAYPTIATLGDVSLASWGIEFDWPKEYLANDRTLSGRAVESLLGRKLAPGDLAPDADGAHYMFQVSPRLLVGGITLSLAKSTAPWRKRLKNYGKKENAIVHALEEAYIGRIMRDAIVHNLPNINAAILGTCEAAENDKFLAPHHAATIKKSCFQIRALVQSTSVLLPSWKPPLASGNPLNAVHRVIWMQSRLWGQDLKDKGIDLQLGQNHSQVHMHPDLLTSLFSNMMSNAAKYALRNSTLKISFDDTDGLIVQFEMDSLLIDPSEVRAIMRPGVRGKRSANTAGHGIGLALVCNIMTGYDGRLEIIPGPENRMAPGYAYNVFKLHFARRWVKHTSVP